MVLYTNYRIVASLTTKVNMIGYVDDSNGKTNQFLADQQPSDQEILELAQYDAQTWNNLLSASGGALELPKCVYQILSWTFMPKGSPIPKGHNTNLKVTVHDEHTKTAHDIPGISAYSAHKTLGHYKDPAGEQKRQRFELEDKCRRATEFMLTSPLTREEAWTYYFSMFQTSVGYPLAASHFTKLVLEKFNESLCPSSSQDAVSTEKRSARLFTAPRIWGEPTFGHYTPSKA